MKLLSNVNFDNKTAQAISLNYSTCGRFANWYLSPLAQDAYQVIDPKTTAIKSPINPQIIYTIPAPTQNNRIYTLLKVISYVTILPLVISLVCKYIFLKNNHFQAVQPYTPPNITPKELFQNFRETLNKLDQVPSIESSKKAIQALQHPETFDWLSGAIYRNFLITAIEVESKGEKHIWELHLSGNRSRGLWIGSGTLGPVGIDTYRADRIFVESENRAGMRLNKGEIEELIPILEAKCPEAFKQVLMKSLPAPVSYEEAKKWLVAICSADWTCPATTC